jgi:pimeloyl-ACP methyl ester carboxylesterase
MTHRKVLYLLPGLLSDSAVWEHQTRVLSAIAEIRIPDFRPFDNFSDMAMHVLEDAPDRFAVAGHSMGGRVALELANMADDRISSMALLDVGAHPVQAGEVEERMILVHVAEREGMEALADAWIPPMLHPDRRHDEALVQKIRAMVLRHESGDYRRHIEAALSREDQSRYLRHIRQKVLLMCGDNDAWSPVAQHRAIAAQLPDAELVVVKDAGHMVTMEQPWQVSSVLLRWFEG